MVDGSRRRDEPAVPCGSDTGRSIAVVTQQLGPVRTGVGTYANHLVAGLRDRGWAVTVLTFEPFCGTIPGVAYVPVSRRRVDPTPGDWWSLSVGAARRLPTLDVDRVHFADAREAYHYRGGAPVTGMVHDAYALDAPRSLGAMRAEHPDWLKRSAYYAFLRRVEPVAYRKLDTVMANADDTRAKVVRHYGLEAERARTVRLGFVPRTPEATTALVGAPSILFVGSNYYRKGLDTLVEAVASASTDARGDGPHLHVVGRDPNRPRIEALAAARGVGDRLTFHGRVEQDALLRMMAGATMLAMPSRTEGYGLVFLEAMVVGTPVIGGRAGGTQELIDDGVNGLLVEPGDAAALADAIRRLDTDDSLRARLAAAGATTVAAHGVDRMVEQTTAAFGAVSHRSVVGVG